MPNQLLGKARREADARADTYVVCYTLNRRAFHDILGPIEDIWRYEALRKVQHIMIRCCLEASWHADCTSACTVLHRALH